MPSVRLLLIKLDLLFGSSPTWKKSITKTASGYFVSAPGRKLFPVSLEYIPVFCIFAAKMDLL
jgi:hypothetical protein